MFLEEQLCSAPSPSGMEGFLAFPDRFGLLFVGRWLTDWVTLYLTVMAGHWLPSTRYDYNDLGGAGA